MKVGDVVRVEHYGDSTAPEFSYVWTGICTWTCGWKYTFLCDDGKFTTWTKSDLEMVGAEILAKV